MEEKITVNLEFYVIFNKILLKDEIIIVIKRKYKTIKAKYMRRGKT